MKDFDSKRAVWYGSRDLAVGFAKDRICKLVLSPGGLKIKSMDDAVEAHQCKLTLEGAPWLFDEGDLPAMQAHAKRAFGEACRHVCSSLARLGVQALLDDTGQQYLAQFWLLLGACGAEEYVDGQELKDLLVKHPNCLGFALEQDKFAKRFDEEIKGAMMERPAVSAELLIDRLATVRTSDCHLYLPRSLGNADIDQIMLAYIRGERPNPNYLDVLSRWPSSKVSCYGPSADVRVEAKRAYDAAMKDMFPGALSVKSSTGVVIDMKQRACRGARIDGFDFTYTFGGQWLEAYRDAVTVLNNCLYLFDYVDKQLLIQMAGHDHEESAFMAAFGPKVLGEYRASLASSRREAAAVMETMAYEGFLSRYGMSLEAALEWAYNTYFAEEFGVEGFGLSLPPVETTYLDRCKGIGSEIERAMKGYSLYREYGAIEADRFPYGQFKTFSAAKSLSKQHKYAVAGKGFEQWAPHLFSDQSMLAHPKDSAEDEHCLFELMTRGAITRGSYEKPFASGWISFWTAAS